MVVILLLASTGMAQTKKTPPQKTNNKTKKEIPYRFRYNYKNDKLTLTFMNGADELKDIQFILTKDTYNEIKSTEVFKQWKTRQDSLMVSGTDAEYYNYRKGQDVVVWFIESQIRITIEMKIKFELNEPYSYDYVQDSQNRIYVKDGEVHLSYFFKAQTPSGVFKKDKRYLTISLVEGNVTTTYL